MSEGRSGREAVSETESAATKRPWHAPTLQEVDVLIDTENGGGSFNYADVSTYQS